jgi:uncharacterized membrane protein YsdA (DUF1294 family)
LLSYYLIINIITFLVWGFDKFRATFKQWRVPEKTLYTVIVLGGGVGALFGMTIFRHKTRKSQFKILAMLSTAIHLIVFFYVLN